MKHSIPAILSAMCLIYSCNNGFNNIFTKQTQHEAYARQVKNDPLGVQWIDVSNRVLTTPQTIELPYRIAGYFHSDKPRALALRFKAKRGERINFELEKNQGQHFILFADLYKYDDTGHTHLLSVDTTTAVFGFNAEESGDYVLRIQPGLYRTGEYDLSASVGPSLGFPVAGTKARTGSFWGDARDAGKRNHEGIDIFAAKRTPVIAAADGYITRVAEGGIGGKTIWMRTNEHDVHLYYAHLDEQLVRDGQSVKLGDTLGLVGNTGNARFTPPHLHFGVYTSSGPVDPLPFVNTKIKIAPAIDAKFLVMHMRLKPTASKRDTSLPGPNEIVVPLAQTKDGYIGELANGRLVQVPRKYVVPVKPGSTQATEETGETSDAG